ncbi:hypothetical protein L1887_17751 [Cichorium endivia]|nr:hypothetical protein L1887_17751 [Cichorium endivia]
MFKLWYILKGIDGTFGIDGPVALPSTCGIRRPRFNLGTPGSWVNCYRSGSNNFNCKELTVLSIWRLNSLLVLISTMGRLDECVIPYCDFWREEPDIVKRPNLAKVVFLVHVLLLGLLNYQRAPKSFGGRGVTYLARVPGGPLRVMT